MTRTRLNRPGLDDYILQHYTKGLAQQIADKFNVTPEYVRNKAKRLGKTQPQKPQERNTTASLSVSVLQTLSVKPLSAYCSKRAM